MTRSVFPRMIILSTVVCLCLSACADSEVDGLFAQRHKLIEDHRKLESGDPNKRPSWEEMHEQSIEMDKKIEDVLKKRGPSVIPALIKRINDGNDGNLCHKILISFGPDAIAPLIDYSREKGDITYPGLILVAIGSPSVEPMYKELGSDQKTMRELACNVLLELAGLRTASDKIDRLPPINPISHQHTHYDEIMKALDAEQDPTVKEKLVALYGATPKNTDMERRISVVTKLKEIIAIDLDPAVHYQAVCSVAASLPNPTAEDYMPMCKFLMKQLELEPESKEKIAILSAFQYMYSPFKPPQSVLRKFIADPDKAVSLTALKTLILNYGDDKNIQKEMISLLKQNQPDVTGVVKLCVYYLNDRDNHPAMDPELNALVYAKKH